MESSQQGLRVAAVAAPVRQQVVRNLRAAILDRTFAPGQRLIERELCELTGVSRTSVREALRQLESEGLVLLLPNRGPVVAEMTAQEAADIYEVRGVLEALAARQFAVRATDDELQALLGTVDRLEQVIQPGELGEIVAAKDEFYAVLLRGARNAVAGSLLESLHARITYLRATSLSSADRSAETIEEVRRIADAIARRDPDEAWEMSRRHVERAAQAAMQILLGE